MLGTLLSGQMNIPFDLLLGRKTFEIWAPHWPQNADAWPGANTATKYVASHTMTAHAWQPSVFLNGDIAEKIAKIKHQATPEAQVAKMVEHRLPGGKVRCEVAPGAAGAQDVENGIKNGTQGVGWWPAAS